MNKRVSHISFPNVPAQIPAKKNLVSICVTIALLRRFSFCLAILLFSQMSASKITRSFAYLHSKLSLPYPTAISKRASICTLRISAVFCLWRRIDNFRKLQTNKFATFNADRCLRATIFFSNPKTLFLNDVRSNSNFKTNSRIGSCHFPTPGRVIQTQETEGKYSEWS